MEQFREIPGCAGYHISNLGRVKSTRRRKPRILKAYPNTGKAQREKYRISYLQVDLYTDEGKRKPSLVHHLVLQVFVGPRPEGMLALHNNGDPSDNRLENLRWGTYSDNIKDTIKHGTHCWSKPFTKKHRENLSQTTKERGSIVKHLKATAEATGEDYELVDRICTEFLNQVST